MHQNRKCFTQQDLQGSERWVLPKNNKTNSPHEHVSTDGRSRNRWLCHCGYLTLSGSVTVKLRSAEQAVSMLGSLVNVPLLLPLSEVQHSDRKSTSRAGVSRLSSTFLGPSSADRWHSAGRRYLTPKKKRRKIR